MRWTPWVAAVALAVLVAGTAAAGPGGKGVCTTETLQNLDNPPAHCSGPTAPPAPSPSSPPPPDLPGGPSLDPQVPQPPSPTLSLEVPPTPQVAGPSVQGPPTSSEPSLPSTDPARSKRVPEPRSVADAQLHRPAFTAVPVEVDACNVDDFPWGPALPFPSAFRREDSSCGGALESPTRSVAPTEPAPVSSATIRTAPPPTRFGVIAAGVGALLLAAVWVIYSRVAGDAAIHHPRRAAILEVLRHEPGLSVQDLSRRLSIHWSRAEYHVHRLRLAGHVVERRVRGRTALFRADDPQRGRQDQLALLRRASFSRVHALLRTRPGLDQASLAASLGMHQPQVSRLLRALQAAGLVAADGTVRPARYRATAAGLPAGPPESATRSS